MFKLEKISNNDNLFWYLVRLVKSPFVNAYWRRIEKRKLDEIDDDWFE